MAQFGIENPLFLDSQEAQDRVRRGIRTTPVGEAEPNVDVGSPKTMPEPRPRMGLRTVESDIDTSYTLDSVPPNTERPATNPIGGRRGYADPVKGDIDTGYELVFKETPKPVVEEPVQGAPANAPDVSRGFSIALGQTPALAKGAVGFVGAAGEKAFGEGGIFSGLKKYGLEGYQQGMKELQAKSKESDDVTVAWDKAKQGDFGALVDWAQYGVGYLGGNIVETVATAALGSVVGTALSGPAAPAGAVAGAVAGVAGKQAVKEATKGILETMVAKEAAKLAEKAGLETATDALTRQATKNVASRIGSTTALAGSSITKETGSIYGEADEEARKAGRELDAGDLARIFGSGVVAGLSETVVDRLGLDAVGGKFKMPGGGRVGRAIVGGGLGVGIEGGQEVFQSVVERFGADKAIGGEEAMREYINSFALGGLGGGTVGGLVGAFKSGKQDSDNTNKLLENARNELTSESGREELFDSMMQDEKIRPILEANGITSGEDPRFTGVVSRALATQRLLVDLEAPTAQEQAKTRKERGADIQAAFGETASTGTGIGTGATEQVIRRDSVVPDADSKALLPADGVAPVPVTLPETQKAAAGSIAMAPEDIVAKQEGFDVLPAIKVGKQTIANRFVTAQKAKYDGQRILLGNAIETSLGQTTDQKEVSALRQKYNELLKGFGLPEVQDWASFTPVFPDLANQEVRVRQGKRSKAVGGGTFFFLESRPAQNSIQSDTQTMAVTAPVGPAANQTAPTATVTPGQLAQPADAKNTQVAQPAGVKNSLPADLAGAKPRYGAGKTQFTLQFDSDIDKALYITAQPTKSKRDADYRGWLKTQGLTDQDIEAGGKQVRESIKAQVKGKPGGELKVAPIQQKGQTNESQTSTSTPAGQPGGSLGSNQVLGQPGVGQTQTTVSQTTQSAGTVKNETRTPAQIKQEATDLWEDNDDGNVMHIPFEKLPKETQQAWIEAYAPTGGARPYATVQLHDEMVAREMRNQRAERANQKAAENRDVDLKQKEPLVRTEPVGNVRTVDELNRSVNAMLERVGSEETFTAERVPLGELIGKVPGIGVIQFTAKAFSKPVVFFRVQPGSANFFNGAVLRGTDTIFVNVTASRPHLRIFGHELVHALRNSDPKTYQRFVNVLAPMLDETGFRAFTNRQRGQGVTQNDKILEEAIGDIVGDRFGETEFWNMVAEENPTMFKQLAKFITDFIDQVLRKANKTLGSETLVKDLQAARAEIAKIVASIDQAQAANTPGGQADFSVAQKSDLVTRPADNKASAAEVRKAEDFREEYDILPYTPEGQIEIPVDRDVMFSIKREGKYGNDPVLGIPLNANGTVTLYFPTSNVEARRVAQQKTLKASDKNANRIYLTNESSGPTVMANPGNIEQAMDGANVLVQVDPRLLQLDQEYENGRKDFFIPIAEGEAFAGKMKQVKLFTLNAPRDKGLSADKTINDITAGVTSGVTKYQNATAAERRALVANAKAVLKREHNLTTLLGENGKLEKTRVGDYGLTYDGKSVASLGFGMASAQKINDRQKLTTCPQSAICESLCLGETSGQNLLYGGDGQYKSGPRLSQYLKTEAVVLHPEETAVILSHEIALFKQWAAKTTETVSIDGKRQTVEKEIFAPAIRLNVTSDFAPKVFEALINAYPDVMYYDYTKLDTKPIAKNHHLTYSSTGFSQVTSGQKVSNKHSNWDRMVRNMNAGLNVAMAFSDSNTMPKFLYDEATGQRFQVWDGDNYDARFLDPKRQDGVGMIIGLTNKDRTKSGVAKVLSSEGPNTGTKAEWRKLLKDASTRDRLKDDKSFPTILSWLDNQGDQVTKKAIVEFADHPTVKSNGFFVDYDPGRDGDTVIVPDQKQFQPGATIKLVPRADTRVEEEAEVMFSRKDYEDQYSDLPANIRETALKKGHYSPPSIKARLQSLTPNMQERLLQGIFDKYRAIKSLGEDLYMKARLANGAQDGALSALLHYGQVFNDGGALNIKKGTKGLIDILAPLGNEVDRFLLWKAANRAEKLKAEEREMYFSDQDIKELKRLNLGTMPNGKSRMATYIKALNDMNDLNRSVLSLPKQAGLITDEAYNRFMSDVWFVPFYRNMEDNTTEGLGAMQGSSKLTSQQFSKKLKGSERPLNDLLENVLLNWSHILSASMKNQTAKEILAKAVQMGAARRVPSAVKGSVKVMEQGKEAHYMVDDPLLLDSLTMISTLPSDGVFTKVASKFKTLLTQTVSLSPTFKINNLIADSIQALAVSDLKKNPVANALEGYRLYRDDRAEALAGGALFTAGVANDGDQAGNVRRLVREASGDNEFVTDFEGLKQVFAKVNDKYQDFSDRFENANRISLYKQMRDKGLSHAEAVYLAKDLQDFSLRGSYGAVQWLSKVLPYFNARLQGMYKLGRGGAEDPRRFATITTATVLAGLALYLSQKDDDDFKKREDWDRDMYWWYKIPGTETAIRIRKPFEVGAISSIIERATEQLVDSSVEGKVFAKRLGAILHDNLAMNPVPQVFRPILDVYANKDSFTDRPIESMGQERLSPELRVNPNTSAAAVSLSKINQVFAELASTVTAGAIKPTSTTLSPVQYDHLLRGYLGWVGSVVQTGSSVLAEPFREWERPDRKIDDMFVVGNFVRDLPASQSRFLSSFYENAKDVAMVTADYRTYLKQGEEAKAAELAAEKGDKLALSKLYSRSQERISNINQEIKRITADKEMDGGQKRMHINRLDQLKIELARQVEDIRVARSRGE